MHTNSWKAFIAVYFYQQPVLYYLSLLNCNAVFFLHFNIITNLLKTSTTFDNTAILQDGHKTVIVRLILFSLRFKVNSWLWQELRKLFRSNCGAFVHMTWSSSADGICPLTDEANVDEKWASSICWCGWDCFLNRFSLFSSRLLTYNKKNILHISQFSCWTFDICVINSTLSSHLENLVL